MKLNWKVILGGGVAMYAAQFLVSGVSGRFIHEGILDPLYKATTAFWRPELNQVPPDMAALMPRWITTGLLMAFVTAAIYDNVRPALNGSGLIKGLKFGFIVALFYAMACASFSGVFNLPDTLWFWWFVDGLVIFLVGGLVLGWFAGKFGGDS